MTQSKRAKTENNCEPRNRSRRSPQESKLNRRSFSLPMKEQKRILKYYRDKGLAYGQASR